MKNNVCCGGKTYRVLGKNGLKMTREYCEIHHKQVDKEPEID